MKTNKAKLAFAFWKKKCKPFRCETQRIILGGIFSGSTGGSWGYVNGEYVYVY